MERERGISITTSVLQFPYHGLQMNLLDTPGHADFSEDTYRTLHAADGAVMLLDCAKGVEPQTKKLFRVCKQRKMPIFTFVNKMDRPGREPFDLIGEVEERARHRRLPDHVARLRRGHGFRGVYHRHTKRVHLFDASRAASSAAIGRRDRRSEGARARRPASLARGARRDGYDAPEDEVELLDAAGDAFDQRALPGGRGLADVLRQRHEQLRPRRPFLDTFCELMPPPPAARIEQPGSIAPESERLQRLRLQDPGEHGQGAPRSRRLHAHLLRAASSAA